MSFDQQESSPTHPLRESSIYRHTDVGMRRESQEEFNGESGKQTEAQVQPIVVPLDQTPILNLINERKPAQEIKQEIQKYSLTLEELKEIRRKIMNELITIDKEYMKANPRSEDMHPLIIEYQSVIELINRKLLRK